MTATAILQLCTLGLICCSIYAYIKYNHVVIRIIGKWLANFRVRFYKLFGVRFRNMNVAFKRSASLNKKSKKYKIYSYYYSILSDLDLQRDGITVVGLISFLAFSSLIVVLCASIYIRLGVLLLPAWGVIFFLLTVAFKLMALSRREHKEAIVIDAVDLLVSDVSSGIFNSIVRYYNSFHPDIQPYFQEFIYNVRNQGYGFTQAMLILNDRLGSEFTSFAKKAILYEEKADTTMSGIFSSIIELNNTKCNLRYINNTIFREARMVFLGSVTVVGFFGAYLLVSDDFVRNLFFNTAVGKCLLIFNILIVVYVLARITALKAVDLD